MTDDTTNDTHPWRIIILDGIENSVMDKKSVLYKWILTVLLFRQTDHRVMFTPISQILCTSDGR